MISSLMLEKYPLLILVTILCIALVFIMRNIYLKILTWRRKKVQNDREFLTQCDVHKDPMCEKIAIATRIMLSQCTDLPKEKIYPNDVISDLFVLGGKHCGSAGLIANYLQSHADFLLTENELSMVINPDIKDDLTVLEFSKNLNDLLKKRNASI